jgi:hypothetical protein
MTKLPLRSCLVPCRPIGYGGANRLVVEGGFMPNETSKALSDFLAAENKISSHCKLFKNKEMGFVRVYFFSLSDSEFCRRYVDYTELFECSFWHFGETMIKNSWFDIKLKIFLVLNEGQLRFFQSVISEKFIYVATSSDNSPFPPN